ncbi:hypothetical protein SmJEL517_g01153 [Synchytrium microbalum]|uniref:Trafficking protein particle complex subunit 11 domain-containing protein n=1 Tax=Synchytrium microbalum TaxID=1806994 RepID=A0A507CG90_9FUNG|nr:uncharacterized protein SmJEL517_g01153 [Synchytrium microbalum]TPX36615.1 hypothetical protein SmJEL517_g01153 [Synchytrium microbalum]
MDSFPVEYVAVQLPVLGVFGLSAEETIPTTITSTTGAATSDTTGSATPAPPSPLSIKKLNTGATSTSPSSTLFKKQLLNALVSKSVGGVWDVTSARNSNQFLVVSFEKTYSLPPRKSPPARNVPIPHSPLSPLTSSSPLYPDGLMTPLWLKRHRELIPSVMVGFYDLWERPSAEQAPDRNRDPLGAQQAATLERERDGLLAQEINDKRRGAQERGIKFSAVILLGKSTKLEDPHTEERLSYLRKACTLDSKHSLFALPFGGGSSFDPQDFAANLQRALYDSALNYYREHGKRVKKKKLKYATTGPVRSIPPPPTASSLSATGSQTSLVGSPAGSPTKPLSSHGWSIRYDFKTAAFSEFRQDFEGAVKSYESAYQTLIEMIQTTVVGGLWAPGGGGGSASDGIQPYTNRWSEARHLLDCISLKICRLLLQSDQPILALSQLNKHLNNLYALPEFVPTTTSSSFITSTLSQTPLSLPPQGLSHLNKPLNGGSFEYWSWVSTQYRAFGELIELATTKMGMKLPVGAPIIPPVSSPDPNAPNSGATPIPASTVNPSTIVQHAGYYYLLAARASEERWKKFKEAEKNMVNAPPLPLAFAPTASRPAAGRSSVSSPFDGRPALDGLSLSPVVSSPSHAHALGLALATERQVDHASLSIELLTKSYEQFKRQRSGRTTLFLASEIARLYETSGKLEMALRFYERIGRTYRKEGWPTVLASVLNGQARCAKALNMWDSFVECSIELLTERMNLNSNDRLSTLEDILSALRGDSATAGTVIKANVEMDIIEPFMHCHIQFKKSTGYAGSPAEYQITLAATSPNTPPATIKLSQLRVIFSDERFNLLVTSPEDDSSTNQETNPIALVAGSTERHPVWVDIKSATRASAPFTIDPQTKFPYLKEADLVIRPGERKVFEGAITPTDSMELRVVRIEGILEGAAGSVVLRWKIGDRNEEAQTRRRWLLSHEAGSKGKWAPLEGYGELSSLRVIRKQPALVVRSIHFPPGYLDEIYPITVEVVNEEAVDIQAFCEFEIRGGGAEGSDPNTYLSSDPDSLANMPSQLPTSPNSPYQSTTRARGISTSSSPPHAPVTTPLTPVIMTSNPTGSTHTLLRGLDLGRLAPGASARHTVYIKSHSVPGERAVIVTVFFRPTSSSSPSSATEGVQDMLNPDLHFRKVEALRIKFDRAFDSNWDVKVYDGRLVNSTEWMQECEWHESWMVTGNLKCVGPWDVEVASGELHQDQDMEVSDLTPIEPGTEPYPTPKLSVSSISPPSPKPETWRPSRAHHFLYRMNMSRCAGLVSSSRTIDIGRMEIKWRRPAHQSNGILMPWTRSVVTIPKLDLAPDGLVVTLQPPSDSSVGNLFTLAYNLYNTSSVSYEISSTLESAEGLVFAGVKSLTCRLLPCSSKTITFNCLPLISGRLQLPKLKIVIKAVGGKERDSGNTAIIPAPSAMSLSGGTSAISSGQTSTVKEADEVRVLGGEGGIFVRPRSMDDNPSHVYK